MAMTVSQHLHKGRQELLDLSTRNRLLSIPTASRTARVIAIHDEVTREVYRLLVNEGKSFTFAPGVTVEKEALEGESQVVDDDEAALPQPDDELMVSGIAKRHTDSRLQTKLKSEVLQRRLLDIYYDARTFIEEQGVNILYLAVGQLRWFDANTSQIERYAPLILVPVQLDRKTAGDRFHLTWNQEDPSENLSLAAKLKADFEIVLPEFKGGEDFDPEQYLAEVTRAIEGRTNWAVLPDAITLGFFSFAKFLMYRDLDPANWPQEIALDKNRMVCALLGEGFPGGDSPFQEGGDLDELIQVQDLTHVMDADSSQSLAIQAARQQVNLVVQGPPGTGKSQTIANIIAAAVCEGKKVLFVAEKMAALEVVYRRLDNAGLGAMCLELHSNKANKRQVLEDIKATKDLGRPRIEDRDAIIVSLEKLRKRLNHHAASMHVLMMPSGATPYEVVGHLIRLSDMRIESYQDYLASPRDWTKSERLERKAVLKDLVDRLKVIGKVQDYPWRGVRVGAILKTDLDRLIDRVRALPHDIDELQRPAAELAELLHQRPADSIAVVEKYLVVADQVAKAPTLDKHAVTNGIWIVGIQRLNEMIEAGKRLEFCRAELANDIADIGWTTDVVEARRNLAMHGESFFSFLNKGYRAAVATLRSIHKGVPPKALRERIALFDTLIEGQQAKFALDETNATGLQAFGSMWNRDRSDWRQLSAIVAWIEGHKKLGLPDKFRDVYASIETPARIPELALDLRTRIGAFIPKIDAIFLQLDLSLEEAFLTIDVKAIPIQPLRERFQSWIAHGEMLPYWIAYRVRATAGRKQGMSGLIDKIETDQVPLDQTIDIFDRAVYEGLLEQAVEMYPDLSQFDGDHHTRVVEDFRDVDRARISLARLETAMVHFQQLPRVGASGVGAMGVLNGELVRKRGHMPLRKLFRMAGAAVQAIKPVFMMSPLSVAQFLEPGAIEFDLLLIDEASQIEPVDALGAIARVKQIVVVGDDKQLPPTRFFSRMTSDSPVSEEDEDAVAGVGDVESVLGLCLSKGLPQLMLRWHYRSKHQSLIAVSNREFYENKLFIVPSPHTAEAGMGLKFHHVPNGVFDSGGTGTNRVEAKIIAQAIINHSINSPSKTLGVATFSIKQKQAILDELELLRRQHPETEAFFNGNPNEPFFVKNLENIQGDERDVIFISVGYGRNSSGYLAMRFGPLSADGGERRLNVLISRAKSRCEVFSSITADDIDLERAKGKGVMALKVFLQFAQSGRMGIPTEAGGEVESPFEEAVLRALQREGYEVRTQIGIAGFFIDLAISDPAFPGRYILGIECDGAGYHSSRSARDRDRLRQAVLEDHGWIIHRIWSTDWFQRPDEQLRRTIAAIEAAKSELNASEELRQSRAAKPVVEMTFVERDNVLEIGIQDASSVVPYTEAHFPVPVSREPHELYAGEMAEIVFKIVDAEGPIHEDEVVTRVRSLWNLSRAGSRIQLAVKNGLTLATRDKRITHDGPFHDLPGRTTRIRDRSGVESGGPRKPEYLPPNEIRRAILELIASHHGAHRDEIPQGLARMLGFKTTSAQLRETIDKGIASLINGSELVESENMLRVSAPS